MSASDSARNTTTYTVDLDLGLVSFGAIAGGAVNGLVYLLRGGSSPVGAVVATAAGAVAGGTGTAVGYMLGTARRS